MQSHVVPLPELAVFEVRGDDRLRWLQGQITADVYAASDSTALHAFHLDAQGRIQAELHIVDDGDRVICVVEADRIDALIAALDRRVVMEDVTLTRTAEEVVGVYGDGADLVAPTAPSVASDRCGPPGYELIVEPGASASVVEKLVAAGCRRTTREELDAERARFGVPRFGVDFGAAIPQETGLARRAVSFTKGCYVGQEPVVMLEHRGKPPRRMVVVALPNEVTTPLDLRDDTGAVVGRCTSATRRAPHVGLAMLKRAFADAERELASDAGTVRVVRVVDLEAI